MFSGLVFLECLEKYSKKKFRFLHIFVTKSCFKVTASATPNKDDQELLSLGPEQAMTSLQESSTHIQCFIVFPYKLIPRSPCKNLWQTKWRPDLSFLICVTVSTAVFSFSPLSEPDIMYSQFFYHTIMILINIGCSI